MGRQEVLICDQCRNQERKSEAFNWIEIDRIGIDTRTAGEKPFEGIYCSRECAVKALQTNA